MPQYQNIKEVLDNAQTVLVIQADNPDADSLASSLALESILEEQGKTVIMQCGIDMPGYLKYLSGWDRVESAIPTNFDASIIVDTSAISLLETLMQSTDKGRVEQKPTVILDHHAGVECDIPFANVVVNADDKISTGELIYDIAQELNWDVSVASGEFIMTSMLADSMGLTTENTTSQAYRTMAELIDLGVSRSKLEEQRREFNKMPEVIFRYKARLMERTEIIDDTIASLVIPQVEINEYSPLFNPGPLVQPEHLQTQGIRITVVYKHYDSGRITATIRCNYGTPIAAKLAKKFGGGGHDYASGFKLDGGDIAQVKRETYDAIRELLQDIES